MGFTKLWQGLVRFFVVQKYSLLLMVLVSCAVAEAPDDNFDVNNSLSECIRLTQQEIITIAEMPFLRLTYNAISSTGHCGCKSAINGFQSYAKQDDFKVFLMSGNFTFMGASEVRLPLAAQKKLIPNGSKIGVDIFCAQNE